jgi:hypothetical protein
VTDWQKTRRRDFDMSSLAEIQEAIEKLASEDRARLREWFDAQDVDETDELLAAIDEVSIRQRPSAPSIGALRLH